jgi:hypothetical protein
MKPALEQRKVIFNKVKTVQNIFMPANLQIDEIVPRARKATICSIFVFYSISSRPVSYFSLIHYRKLQDSLCINYALNFSQNSGNTTVLVGSSAY